MIGNRTLTLVLALATATMAAGALRAGESASSDAPGAVYALTNSPAGNAVLVYHRDADGSLTPAGAYPTDGAGGAGLSSQGAVVVSDDGRLLFAVNAGSNSISSFQIRPDGLELASTTSSGGTTPVSVAFRGGKPIARSDQTSSNCPPAPKRMIGPKSGSILFLRINSTASSSFLAMDVSTTGIP